MKHERASTSRSTMQTHRLAIELNSSADLSKSTPDGDEDLFLRHGPSSRRPIRVTVEGRLAAATISMDGGRVCPFCDTRYGARGVEFCRSGQLAPSGAIRPRVRSGRIVTTLLLTAGTLKAITGWVRPLRVSAPSWSVSMLPLSAALTRWLRRIFRWTRLEVAARLGRLG